MEAARQFPFPSEHPHLVVLGIRDESTLDRVRQQLVDSSLQHTAFHEPDLGNSMTSIATRPVHGQERCFFRKFQLLKGARS